MLKLGQIGAIAQRQSAFHIDRAESLCPIRRISAWAWDKTASEGTYLAV